MHIFYVNFQQMFIFRWTIPASRLLQNNTTVLILKKERCRVMIDSFKVRISLEMGKQAKIVGCQTEWCKVWEVNLTGSEWLHYGGSERRFKSPWRHSGRVSGAYILQIYCGGEIKSMFALCCIKGRRFIYFFVMLFCVYMQHSTLGKEK